MNGNNRTGSGAARARGFMALFAFMLTTGLGLLASPAEAAPRGRGVLWPSSRSC